MIQERIRQGVYVKDVASELGVHPRTVSRALKRGGSPPGERPRPARASWIGTNQQSIGCWQQECGTRR
jgi:IS30 family transposase